MPIGRHRSDVRFWHLADNAFCLALRPLMTQSGHCSLDLGCRAIPSVLFTFPPVETLNKPAWTAPKACALFVNSLVVSLGQSRSAQRIRIPVG